MVVLGITLTNYFNGKEVGNYVAEITTSNIQNETKQETETKEAVNVTAELPGIDEKNLDLQISSDGYLSLCGEKKNTFEKTDKDAYFSEISYGIFKRTVPLPWDLDYDKVAATYNNGVLNVSIPKSSEEKQKFKKIELSSSKN